MHQLIIDIEIKNIFEIVKKRKGRISAFIAKYFVREEFVRKEVEQRILQEIKKGLESNLLIKLQQEGIRADVVVSIASNNDRKFS
jgi:hypothetical protein